MVGGVGHDLYLGKNEDNAGNETDLLSWTDKTERFAKQNRQPIESLNCEQ